MFDFFFRGAKVTEPKYAQRLIARIRESEPDLKLSYDEKSHLLSVGTTPVQKRFLANMFKDYMRASQEERDSLLTRHAIVCTSIPDFPGAEAAYDRDVRPHLVPIVRSRSCAYEAQTLDPAQFVEGLAGPVDLSSIPGRVIGEDRACIWRSTPNIRWPKCRPALLLNGASISSARWLTPRPTCEPPQCQLGSRWKAVSSAATGTTPTTAPA